MIVGIDIEQFVRVPYATGIQRVLQHLAGNWPNDSLRAEFVIPTESGFSALTPEQAHDLLSLPFSHPPMELRDAVDSWIRSEPKPNFTLSGLLARYDAWLLPEVSYLPAVLERMEIFRRCMPTTMIGYDILPMTEPWNYRFRPGAGANVSEYFRLLTLVDSVVCISAHSANAIITRLRRDDARPIAVAHPGGDHIVIEQADPPRRPRFLRVGTLEERKMPMEILRGFQIARRDGIDAELLFIGHPSFSNTTINDALSDAQTKDTQVRWVPEASDEQVVEHIRTSSLFMSYGVEGYGIPVLEAIRLGTPVAFGGVQPAAELMVGRGAVRMDAKTPEEFAQVFRELCNPGHIDRLRIACDPHAVPTWHDFAQGVATAVHKGV